MTAGMWERVLVHQRANADGRGRRTLRRWLLLASVMIAGALVFVPLAAGRADGQQRSLLNCSGRYMPDCTISYTITEVPTGDDPSWNPPSLSYPNSSARWKVTATNWWGDGCSDPIIGLAVTSGPNAGSSPTVRTSGQDTYVSYTPRYAGNDHIKISITIPGCNSWQYVVFINGSQETTFVDGSLQPTNPYTTQVGWGNDFWDNGECDDPWAPAFHFQGSAFRRQYQAQCVDDPVSDGLGRYEAAVTDATVASPGLPFAFTRSYTSGDNFSSELGYGWHTVYGSRLTINTSVSPNTATAHMGSGQQIVFTKNQDGTWAAPSWTTATLTYASGTYTLSQSDRTTWSFNSSGALTAITDRNGQRETVSGSVGAPMSVTLSNGKQITFTRDGTGRTTMITLPDNRTVSYVYSSAGDLITVTDLRGGTTHYTYNSYHQLLTVTDPRGHVVLTNVYGDYGRLASQTDALGNTTTYGWTDCNVICGLPTSSATDPRGNTWTNTYTYDGLLLSQRDPLGDTSAYSNDTTTREPLSYTDALGNTVSYGYDSQQNLTQTTLPGPISSSATYNSSGGLLTSTDGRGYTTSDTYDTSGNPTLVTQPGGATVAMTYNAAGQLTGVTDQAAKTTSYGYDSAGNLASTTSPLANETTYGYDSAGRRTSIVDPRGNVSGGTPNTYKTTIAYDNGDEVTSVTDPLGDATTYTYDADGNLTSVTDPNDNTWTYSYDADNRLTQETAPDLSTTTYAYDQVGNLVTRTDGNQNSTIYAYDLDNRLITITDPLDRTWILGYDADSNLVSVATPSDGTISYLYNSLGQQISTTYSDGTPSVSWSYDDDGNIATMSDGDGTVNYSYNQLDQLTQASRGSDTFTYTYDPVGRIATRTIPDGTTTSYTYTDDGTLATATTGSQVTSYQYDPAGNLTQTTLPNGVVETSSYDPAGRLTQLDDGFRSFGYGYDPAGNLTSRTIDGVASDYGYDTLNRLTSITGPTSISYGYDPVGNRTSMTDTSGTTTYSYDLADQLQSATGPGGTTDYGFDQNGNETSAGAWTYTYNLAGQLTAASNGTTTINYGYDGNNDRITTTVDGTTTDSLWDTNNPLPQLALERDSDGNLIRRYTYGNDRISMTTPDTTAYYSTDMLGTVTELSSPDASQLGQYDNNPFGDNATATNLDPSVANNPFLYTGQYQDPTTSLYNLRARNYDPTTSRFTTPDPLAPQSHASTYTYTANNPLTYTDPSGMKRGGRCGSKSCWVKSGGPFTTPPNPLDVAETVVDEGAGCWAGAKFGGWFGAIPNPWIPLTESSGIVVGCVGGAALAVVGGDQVIPDPPDAHR
jgi:RHS repeat-associated protein